MTGVLAGVRVLEHGTFITGPAAAMLLADLGADVVVIDRVQPDAPEADLSRHALSRRGKRAVAIDLKTPAGVVTVLPAVAPAAPRLPGPVSAP